MTVKITMSGDGMNYEGETNLVKASQVIVFISTESIVPAATSRYTSGEQNKLPIESGQVSPRQALLESGAETNPQKITVLGNYVSKKNSDSSFSLKELQEAFRRAGESIPRNFGRDIKLAVNLGFICLTDGGSDMYYVTDLGLEQISSHFLTSVNNVRSGSIKKRSLSRERASTGLNDEIKNLEVEPQSDKLPNYWGEGLKENKSLRIVWLLAFAKSKNIEELSAMDIEYLAKKLADDIRASSVPSKSFGLMKKGYITKNPNGRFRILKSGGDFVNSLI